MTRLVNRVSPKRANRKLWRVHTDIWGPYRVRSLGGNAYFVSLIDDFTRRSWLVCIKIRKDIYRKITEWQTATELQVGEKVAIYRCDNAKEYQKLERLIYEKGTRMEYTTAYTPEQNGVAERFNRTIIQMARAMLIWSELPHSFWGEAACTANYIRNLLPSGQDDLSPSEQWHGHKPNVAYIRTFGCLVHVLIPSETRAKLDRVSFYGIFVGYHSEHQYRVYNPATRKIQWYTSMRFLEKIPGGRLLQKETRLDLLQQATPTETLPSYTDGDDNSDHDDHDLDHPNISNETSNLEDHQQVGDPHQDDDHMSVRDNTEKSLSPSDTRTEADVLQPNSNDQQNSNVLPPSISKSKGRVNTNEPVRRSRSHHKTL